MTVFNGTFPGAQSLENDGPPILVANAFHFVGATDRTVTGVSVHIPPALADSVPDWLEVYLWTTPDLGTTPARTVAAVEVMSGGWVTGTFDTPWVAPANNTPFWVGYQLGGTHAIPGQLYLAHSPGNGAEISGGGTVRLSASRPTSGWDRGLFRYGTTGITEVSAETLWGVDVVVAGVTPPAPSSTSTVTAVNVSTGWTPVGGTVLAALSDGLNSTYVSSPENPNGLVLDVNLGPLTPPASGQGAQVVLQGLHHTETASSASATVALYNGATLRATSAPVPITASPTDAVFTFAPGDIVSVNWSTVRCVVTVSAVA